LERINKIINNTILSCLAIQIFSVSFSIAVSSIAFGIWGGLWILQVLFIDRKLNYEKQLFKEIRWINIFIAVLIIADLVSRIFAFYPDGAMLGFKRNLLFLVFFACLIKINDLETFKKILIVNIAVMSIISLLEIIYFFAYLKEELVYLPFNQIRIDYLNHPLTMSEIKMMFILQFLPFLFWKENIFLKKKYIVAMFIPMLISIFLSQSRSVYAALFVCILIYSFYYNWKFGVGFIVVTVLIMLALPNNLLRVQSIFDSDMASAVERTVIWENGWEMFKHNPWIGVGDHDLMQICKFYKPEYGKEMEQYAHLHSNPLMILATMGLLGAVGFVGMFGMFFYKTVKLFERSRDNSIKQFIFGSVLVIIGFQISGFTEWSFGDAEVFTVLFFLLSLPFVLYKIRNKEFT